ncbi:helix-turn-helix transcriptional regulator [Streptomyces piniterrae]|uniref:Helix-turn-helix transcriptional regulator n=1 Tax=Streptomyces piniterrae TaxID=2571125 RepID=A0A4U0NWC8_9ACTN|nr:helix-turn-helix transcriptional regulator [Streptomyces piniterrae]
MVFNQKRTLGAVYGFHRTLGKPESAREDNVTTPSHRAAPEHTHPDDVPLLAALAALADPVRLTLVRELAGSPEWSRACGSFDVPVGKAALSHHFAVLRGAGLVEQRDQGPKRVNRLRRAEFDTRFPGLLQLVLRPDRPD